MINKSTGEITIESIPLTLGPAFARNDLLSSAMAGQLRPGPGNPPYYSYSIGVQLISESPFFVTLYFYDQKLESVELYYSAEKPAVVSEADRKKMHDRWLIGLLGHASKRYGWGEVASSYDPRSDSSSIVIRYSWQGQPWPMPRPRS